jgi:hypothetical protein
VREERPAFWEQTGKAKKTQNALERPPRAMSATGDGTPAAGSLNRHKTRPDCENGLKKEAMYLLALPVWIYAMPKMGRRPITESYD